jgi:hypothetical protein
MSVKLEFYLFYNRMENVDIYVVRPKIYELLYTKSSQMGVDLVGVKTECKMYGCCSI